MGLDLVELAIEVEEAFGIKISDERAERIHTVGGLYDLIIELQGDGVAGRDACLSSAMFYTIRRALVSDLAIGPKTVRPGTSVDAILPKSTRRRFWSRLQKAIGFRLPGLARPKWMVFTSWIATIGISAWITMLAYRMFGENSAILVSIGSVIGFGVLLFLLTTPFAINVRPAFETFRGLTNVAMAGNYSALVARFNVSNSRDIWESLRVIISEQLGVEPDLVVREASFVNDLGAG